MAIQTSSPVVLQHPEIPFDKLALTVAISPLYEEKRIGASVAITLTPYRVLPDETIEVRREDMRAISIGDAFIQAQTDPALAKAVTAIYSALGQFVSEKGL